MKPWLGAAVLLAQFQVPSYKVVAKVPVRPNDTSLIWRVARRVDPGAGARDFRLELARETKVIARRDFESLYPGESTGWHFEQAIEVGGINYLIITSLIRKEPPLYHRAACAPGSEIKVVTELQGDDAPTMTAEQREDARKILRGMNLPPPDIPSGPGVDGVTEFNGVRFGDKPAKRSDARRWHIVREEKGGAFYSRDGERLEWMGIPMDRVVYTEDKKGAGIMLISIRISGEQRCARLRQSLETIWGTPQQIQLHAEWHEWRGDRVEAELDARSPGACVLQLQDKTYGRASKRR